MYRRLSADGISRSQFRSNLRDQMLLSRVREREVGQRVKVSELDIDRYLLDQQRESGGALADVNIAHILLALPESPTPAQVAAAQAKAQQIIERVRAGEDFSRLARELSQAPDAADGRRVRAASASTVIRNCSSMRYRICEPGAMTIVRSGAGLHVFKLLEKRVPGAPATSVVADPGQPHPAAPDSHLERSGRDRQAAELRQTHRVGPDQFRSGWPRSFRRTAARRRAAISAGLSPDSSFPSSRKPWRRWQPGDISAPLVSRFGVHLIQVSERRTTAAECA